MCGLEDYRKAKRCAHGKAVEAPQTPFRVWGLLDGERFDRTFPSARAWRAWRAMQRDEVEVLGMQSEAAECA